MSCSRAGFSWQDFNLVVLSTAVFPQRREADDTAWTVGWTPNSQTKAAQQRC